MVGKQKSRKNAKECLGREALELVAARFRVLGEATRLELLQLVMNGEKSVHELCELTSMSQANISKHLSILADHGILSRHKQGLFVYYSVADQSISELCYLVCGAISERLSKAQNHFR